MPTTLAPNASSQSSVVPPLTPSSVNEITSSTLERITLFNELKALNLKQVELKLAPFELSPHYGSLLLGGTLGQIELTCPDLSLLWQLPELAAITAQEPNAPYLSLPDELILAALEVNLRPHLEAIAKTLGIKLEVTQYRIKEQAPSARPYLSQSFTYNLGPLKLPLTLSCPDNFSAILLINTVQDYHEKIHQARKMLQSLSAMPLVAEHHHELKEQTMVPMAISIGSAQVSLATLKSLQLGDALILSECYLPQDEALISYLSAQLELCARAKLNAGQFELQTNFVPHSALFAVIEGQTMAEQEETNPELNQQAPEDKESPAEQDEPIALDELQLKVSLVLDEQLMPLSTLQELKLGSIVPLVHHDLNHVALVVNGQTVGYGRVVTLGTDFAVQLTKLAATAHQN